MINFCGSLDRDLDVPSFVKSTLNSRFILLVNFFLGFERLKCRFQIFISLLPNFSNRFEYNATKFDSLKKKTTTMISKKVHYSVLLPKNDWNVF
jgi:hypothetical protein